MKETEIHHVTAPVLSFLSTFLVTLTNPMTVFAFAAIFVTIGVVDLIHNHTSAVLLVAGVFAGSLSWFSLQPALSAWAASPAAVLSFCPTAIRQACVCRPVRRP